jgi:DNA-directed RNA polymerase delta subunit
LKNFLSSLKGIDSRFQKEDVLKRWLSMARVIDCNALGEWGRASSPSINAKGVRDYAYLAMRRHGSPMHFREVSKSILDLFKKKAHPATCHNELIKDNRFVLVGRGLYALRDWGYKEGVVRDVISEILKKEGPLSKQEIFDRVKRERYVKDNTILVNLHQHFKKQKDGRYTLA